MDSVVLELYMHETLSVMVLLGFMNQTFLQSSHSCGVPALWGQAAGEFSCLILLNLSIERKLSTYCGNQSSWEHGERRDCTVSILLLNLLFQFFGGHTWWYSHANCSAQGLFLPWGIKLGLLTLNSSL